MEQYLLAVPSHFGLHAMMFATKPVWGAGGLPAP